ncbi:MAG: SDR family oxidoreductase [Pseudonocardiales bacterium]|nr:SDR family oxidoreductase [Pseudonocardiales bacterium]
MADGAGGALAITGSTGRLGVRIARRLADAGAAQRLLVRDPSRAPQLPGARLAEASYDDTDAVRTALTGIETVLMVSAEENEHRVDVHKAFIDAAVDAGVRRLVYISFSGAAPDTTFTLGRDHWATEEYLRANGMATTMLRDNIYLDFVPMLIGEDGVIRGPAGDGRLAAVAQDDIADVATAVLLDPARHESAVYTLTGPEAISLDEAAAELTRHTGREVRYQPETVEEAYASRASTGAPQWQLDAWVSTYTAIANGELAGVTDDVPRLTGHPATSLTELLTR